jgi:hypothetical protein
VSSAIEAKNPTGGIMIKSVRIYLDDNVPPYMEGIIRCGSVISEDDKGKERDHQELVDNKEFHTREELIKDVSDRLRVKKEICEVVD